jgi:phenylpropionate dioxygenase-like ring-hydroxylating dioxygenase large terminal subunit
MEYLDTLLRHWFPLCRSSELKDRPLARTLLGQPLALFRTPGSVGALADRCPHRNAPLSAGRARGETIQCPYHGWQFYASGACRAVPGLCGPATHPTRAVAAFPAVERDGLVWASLSGEGEPRILPQPAGRGVARAVRSFRVAARLADALENFLDGTHTHFVHAGLVRQEGPRRRVTAVVRRGADSVEAEYLGEGQQSGVVSRLFGGGVDTSLGRFVLPSTVQLEYRSSARVRLQITLYFTPEGDEALRVFAVASGSTAPLPPWLALPPLALLLRHIVRQDRRILALQLANLRRHGGERYASTELDVMRPHVLRLLRGGADPADATHFERRVAMLL